METVTNKSTQLSYATAKIHRDSDTIFTFHCGFLELVCGLHLVLEIAQRMKLVEVGDVAIGGSQAKANASKNKAMSKERYCTLQ